MPFRLYQKGMVYPKMKIIGPAGNTIAEIPLAEYSSGFYSLDSPAIDRRPRPPSLISPEAMTGHIGGATTDAYYAPYSYSYQMYGYTYVYEDLNSADFLAPGSPGPPQSPDWQTKLLLAVKDQKVNGVVMAAEAGKAMDMFHDNAKVIVRVLNDLRRGDVPGAMRHLGLKPRKIRGTVASRWLELRYGWMPLLQDLHGAVSELSRGGVVQQYRVMHTRAVAENRVLRSQAMPGGGKLSELGTYRIVAKVTVYLKQKNSLMTRVGVTNPAAVLWELVPYSFVIDWLIPIGDWLNSLDANIGTIEAFGTVTFKEKIISHVSNGGFYTRFTHTRLPLMGLPQPVLPRYEPSLNAVRVLNALAILSNFKR